MEILKFIIGLILFLIMLYLAYKGVYKIYGIWKDYTYWKERKETSYADSPTISFQHFIDLYEVFPNRWRTNETTVTYDCGRKYSTFMWESYSDRTKYLKWVKEKDKKENAERSRQKTLEILMEIQKDIEGMMEGKEGT
jgi:hypothetical protein